MPRFDKYKPVYAMFQRFVDRCILSEQSLLWPNIHAWTNETVQALNERFVDNPLTDKRAFQDKLAQQMQGASQETWVALTEVWYVYLLVACVDCRKQTISIVKKREQLQWAARQAGLALPDEQLIWDAQRTGIAVPGSQYNHKYAEFRYIINFIDLMKQASDVSNLIQDRMKLQAVMDAVLQNTPSTDRRGGGTHGMRNALLYLFFPEFYEPIISQGAKDKIKLAFGKQVGEGIPHDVDEALYQIRSRLTPAYGSKKQVFSFFDPNLKKLWEPSEDDDSDTESSTVPIDDGLERDVIDDYTASLLSQLLDIARFTKNIILQGSPGTGKTYIADKFARALVADQTQTAEPAQIQDVIQGLDFLDILALSMYLADSTKRIRKYLVPEILAQPVISTRFEVNPVRNPGNQLWFYLQRHTSPESQTVKVEKRAEPYLFQKDEESRWSLTDIGRQHVEEQLADQLAQLQVSKKTKRAEDFIKWVTFHQSYSYEDFVEGLRPVIKADESLTSDNLSYEIRPGIFYQICQMARIDSENKYVLVIDEINRGNIAKIFGELITLIEDDKRDSLSVQLPYRQQEFTVPKNLYIIGTMNTADRSIALLDVALRRRFIFVKVSATTEVLTDITLGEGENELNLGELLRALNSKLATYLDEGQEIGHSYLLVVKKAAQNGVEPIVALEYVWNNQILPLLEEYFYSDRRSLAQILSPFILPISGTDNFEIAHQSGVTLVASLRKLVL